VDRSALVQLVRDHQAGVYRFLRFLGADEHLAEDLTQEAFLVACRRDLGRAEDVDDVGKYLRGIARNLFLAHCRKNRTSPVVINSELAEQAQGVFETTFLRHGDGDDYIEALQQCLGQLPPRQRQMLDMQYAQKKSREELAAAAGMSCDGIKSLMRRLRAALARCVNGRLGVVTSEERKQV